VFIVFSAVAAFAAAPAFAASGAEIFQTVCVACHTIGGGHLVGPDLAGVRERHSRQWLEQFVRSSQSMVRAGDAEAVAVFEANGRIPMPDAPLDAAGVRAVVDYLVHVREGHERDAPTLGGSHLAAASNAAASATPAAEPAAPASDAAIRLGQSLFQGTVRFESGGPACNSCHDVKNDAVIGGGILARELTTVFSRLGGAGVHAILGQAPFPVMNRAYADAPLTQGERDALVAFLEDADAQHFYHEPRDYGFGLFSSGVAGAALLYGLCALVWRRRKSRTVYDAIFRRQMQSH